MIDVSSIAETLETDAAGIPARLEELVAASQRDSAPKVAEDEQEPPPAADTDELKLAAEWLASLTKKRQAKPDVRMHDTDRKLKGLLERITELRGPAARKDES
jgi:hypothetical protein